MNEARLRNDHAGDGSGQEATDGEGRGDDAIRPNAERLSHPKILRRRAHLEAKARRAQEPGRAGEKREAHDDRYEMEELQADAGDLNLPRQTGQEIDALGARADDHDQGLLKKKAHRKRRDEQCLRIGASERPESGPLGHECEDNRRERGGNDSERC